jgi:hypothetical protein
MFYKILPWLTIETCGLKLSNYLYLYLYIFCCKIVILGVKNRLRDAILIVIIQPCSYSIINIYIVILMPLSHETRNSLKIYNIKGQSDQNICLRF